MSLSTPIHRRDAVTALGRCAAAFVVLRGDRSGIVASDVVPADAVEWLRARVPEAFAREAATSWLEIAPTDRAPGVLADYARRLAPHTPAGFERTRRELQRDYRSGRVVRINGWYISRTEARLIAAAGQARKA
ncbi:MAG: hypothetical protein ABI877_19580 [Gemmatimonadaceae bacterium]